MNVIDKRKNTYKFEELNKGDTFMIGSNLCIKINDEYNELNTFDITNREEIHCDGNVLIIAVNTEICIID